MSKCINHNQTRIINIISSVDCARSNRHPHPYHEDPQDPWDHPVLGLHPPVLPWWSEKEAHHKQCFTGTQSVFHKFVIVTVTDTEAKICGHCLWCLPDQYWVQWRLRWLPVAASTTWACTGRVRQPLARPKCANKMMKNQTIHLSGLFSSKYQPLEHWWSCQLTVIRLSWSHRPQQTFCQRCERHTAWTAVPSTEVKLKYYMFWNMKISD